MKIKMTGRAFPVAFAVFVGTVMALGLTVSAAGVTAALVLGGRIPELGVGYCGYVIVPLSVALGAALAFAMAKRRHLLISVLVGGVYYAALAGTAAAFFGGVHHGALLTAVLSLSGALVVGVAGNRRRGMGRFDGRKYRPR